ncbi:hypothetical protein ABEX69_04455 [Bacillus safensis]|uniref:hypothetical protein n=1 Tax=Bacillus safensis TaxID=561879 RepID=UPI00223740D8|nr:hypothetical protein [Bacillus safensis]MCW4645645.1 hypothetical protein [Bacillus safensis]MCY7625004.1 hypothetical protein [Bacillus safensis]MCY7631616.1 hypothetical protein [Bacillus safensis]MCY7648193.1 hypothetical protein [Bacillus safensis]MCY7651149.1 hypothetical protein [Bacillus safensis]
MSKSKIWFVAVLAVLVLGAVSWSAYQAIGKKSALNQSYAFAQKTKEGVNWFKVTERKGKVTGHLNETILEESPEMHFDPNLFKHKYQLTGKAIENGYEFEVKRGKDSVMYEVHVAGKDLYVKKQGENKSITYKAVDQKKLNAYQKAIQDRYDELIDDSETRFYDYLRDYIKKVTGAYGYLYTAEDGSYQLFLQVKHMHIESEWSGAFLMRTVPGDGGEPYKETKHKASGVSDGIMFDISTYPQIEEHKTGIIVGSTNRGAKSIKLPLKIAGGIVEFKPVSKQEYQKQSEAFKKQAEEKKK